jgi:hypothetical protein
MGPLAYIAKENLLILFSYVTCFLLLIFSDKLPPKISKYISYIVFLLNLLVLALIFKSVGLTVPVHTAFLLFINIVLFFAFFVRRLFVVLMFLILLFFTAVFSVLGFGGAAEYFAVMCFFGAVLLVGRSLFYEEKSN